MNRSTLAERLRLDFGLDFELVFEFGIKNNIDPIDKMGILAISCSYQSNTEKVGLPEIPMAPYATDDKESLSMMETQSFSLSTDAMDEYGFIDARYTCDLDNSSPELRWENVPVGTAGFAVIAEDPDAHGGVFTHWVIYNIPAQVHHLPAGIPPQDTLPNGIRQGINSFGKLGYAGPCPPSGDHSHRYIFKVFALVQLPLLNSRLRREEVLLAIQPYIIETAQIDGRYQRSLQRAG